jgi:hypothetical protein
MHVCQHPGRAQRARSGGVGGRWLKPPLRSKTQLTKEILAEAKRLLCIGTFCIGTDQACAHATHTTPRVHGVARTQAQSPG